MNKPEERLTTTIDGVAYYMIPCKGVAFKGNYSVLRPSDPVEADRLDRLASYEALGTVKDFARLKQGVKEISFDRISPHVFDGCWGSHADQD